MISPRSERLEQAQFFWPGLDSAMDEYWKGSASKEAQEKDARLFTQIAQHVTPFNVLREQLPQVVLPSLDGEGPPFHIEIPFRNRELAEVLSEGPTIPGIDRLEEMMRVHGGWDIDVPHVTLKEGNMYEDLTIIGATNRGEAQMVDAIWVRDQAQIAMAETEMWSRGRNQVGHPYEKEGQNARGVFKSLLTIMSTPSQLGKFDGMLTYGDDPKYRDDPKNWPQIFLHRNNLNGEMTEGWAHKQDAWQMLVYGTLDAIEKGLLTVEDLEPSHREFLGYVIPFLNAAHFWENPNSGSWEEATAVRSSTLAWDTVIIPQLKDYAQKPEFGFIKDQFEGLAAGGKISNGSSDFDECADGLVQKGKEKLASLKLWESRIDPSNLNEPGMDRQADAALLYFLELGIDDKFFDETEGIPKSVEEEVLRNVYTLWDPRTGGIKRYLNDSYQGLNFYTHDVQEKLQRLYSGATPSSDFSGIGHFTGRNKIVAKDLGNAEGTEAAWTHFNFQLSDWAGKKYRETRDSRWKHIQESHFLYGLSAVTGEGEHSIHVNSDGVFMQEIPAYRIPECYITMRDPSGVDYVMPGPYTPLNWAVALGHKALCGIRETLLWEEQNITPS